MEIMLQEVEKFSTGEFADNVCRYIGALRKYISRQSAKHGILIFNNKIQFLWEPKSCKLNNSWDLSG